MRMDLRLASSFFQTKPYYSQHIYDNIVLFIYNEMRAMESH